MSFAGGIGVALAAATGAGTIDIDPVVGSAAVAGAAAGSACAQGVPRGGGGTTEFQMIDAASACPAGSQLQQRKGRKSSLTGDVTADEQQQLFRAKAGEMNGNFVTTTPNTESVSLKNGQYMCQPIKASLYLWLMFSRVFFCRILAI